MPREEAGLGVEVAPENQLTQFAPERESNLLDRLIVLAERRTFIVIFVGIAGVVSAVVSLLLPFTYAANAKIMPPQQSSSIATAMLAQLGPLAAVAGNQLGLRNPSDLYVAMLHSRTVTDDLIQRFDLMQVYHLKKIDDVRRRLASLTEINAGRDGVISVSVEDRDPQRAADLANGYVEELEKLTQTLAVTEAGKRRLFFEREVQTANEDLAKAEVALKQTQETTGMIQLDSESRAMIEAMITLRAQLAAKEVQIQAIRSYAASDNPELKVAEDEMAALKTQLARFERGQTSSDSMLDLPLSKIPSAGLEYVRRLREVKYREALLEVLTKQYEIARIDQAKDAAVIQAMDNAVRATERAGPHRTMIVIQSVFVAFWLAIGLVFLGRSMERAKEDPLRASQLQRLKDLCLGRKGR